MTFDLNTALIQTDLALPKRSGKVRDVYDAGDQLLIVSTDRISAFDWVLPVGIHGKGIVLNQLSRFWFDKISVPNHCISCDIPDWLNLPQDQLTSLAGRTTLARKAKVIPYECVVRGYLEGSGWREYQQNGAVCGIHLPPGLRQCDRLPEPIFTPATKAEAGHDINVSFETMADDIGFELADRLRAMSLDVYEQGSRLALQKGIIIADTKFEWGWFANDVILIDEVLTPDSSRFWPLDHYKPGENQPSYDKQYVREWLMESDWDRQSPPPALPDEVIARTREKYLSVYQLLTGKSLS